MIIVTGAPRSGTSLTMQVLRACGARLGEVDGLCEPFRLKDEVVKPYLRQIGADPLGQRPLPKLKDIRADRTFGDRVRRAVGDATAFKTIKGVLVWPIFAEHFPDARWIICHRSPADIAQSCLRVGFLTKYDSPKEWSTWARAYHRRCAQLRESAQTMTIEPGRFIGGDFEQLREAVEWAGLDFNEDAVAAVIRPEKWGGR